MISGLTKFIKMKKLKKSKCRQGWLRCEFKRTVRVGHGKLCSILEDKLRLSSVCRLPNPISGEKGTVKNRDSEDQSTDDVPVAVHITVGNLDHSENLSCIR